MVRLLLLDTLRTVRDTTVVEFSLPSTNTTKQGRRTMAMRRFLSNLLRLSVVVLLMAPTEVSAQGTLADYERADSFDVRTRGLVLNVVEEPSWIGETSRFCP